MTGWIATGRALDEFWSCSPAQIGFVIEAYVESENRKWGGKAKRKGTAADFVTRFGGSLRNAGVDLGATATTPPAVPTVPTPGLNTAARA